MKSNFFLLFFVFMSYFSMAQDFSVSPVNLNFFAEPGESQALQMTVRNFASKRATFNISVQDEKMSNRKDTKIVDTANFKNRSCAGWLNITPSFFELNPNEEVVVKVSIEVPSGEFNTRFSKLVVGTIKEQSSFDSDKSLGTGMVVAGRIAVKVVQSPKSNIEYEAKISQFAEITKPADSTRSFLIEVENNGDKIINGGVYFIASNLATADEIQFPSEKIVRGVLPGTKKQYTLKLPKTPVLPAGKYYLAAILDYSKDKNLEGAQILFEVK